MKELMLRSHQKIKNIRWLSDKPAYLYFAVGAFFLLFLTYYFLYIGSITNFKEGKTVFLKKGMSAKTIGLTLEDAKAVPSGSMLTLLVVAFGYENKIVSGAYYFEKEEGVVSVFKRITSGDFKTKPILITFPEGFTVRQVADRLKAQLKEFDGEKFYELAKSREGYLFPESYYFLPDADPKDVLDAFEQEFDKNISELKYEIKKSKKSLEEIIILASILEREVRSLEEKKVVAGILYKRMAIGMPLQVDATFAYERGQASHELSTADLRKDSPYNTYTNKGLPPTPISNPGINAIKAALEPTESEYLYFLTDSIGTVHYAKTFEEHVANKRKYIY